MDLILIEIEGIIAADNGAQCLLRLGNNHRLGPLSGSLLSQSWTDDGTKRNKCAGNGNSFHG